MKKLTYIKLHALSTKALPTLKKKNPSKISHVQDRKALLKTFVLSGFSQSIQFFHTIWSYIRRTTFLNLFPYAQKQNIVHWCRSKLSLKCI